MTRLKEEWISGIEKDLLAYDQRLLDKIGIDLVGLAAKSVGINANILRKAALDLLVAAVPVRAGQGIIGQFSQSVAAIVGHMGFKVMVTDASDVDGIYEAYSSGADCIMMADDERFIGFNVHTGKLSENNQATAKGYIAALDQMAKGLTGKEVLVLGYGCVGKLMVSMLKDRGAIPAVYEKDQGKLDPKSPKFIKTKELIKNYSLIIDATNTGGWLSKDLLHEGALISSPGIPLALDREAYIEFESRLIHDWLQLGTGVMMAELCI